MNNLEYLNEISKSNRPVAKPKGLSTGLIIKIALGGLVAFIILIAFGSALNNNSVKSSDLLDQLYFRTVNVNSVITQYNSKLKSSRLRSIASSLSATLTSGSNELANYYKSKGIKVDDNVKVAAAETNQKDEFNTALNNARLNGILDRIYTSQVQLQVSLLLSQLSANYQRAKDETLRNIIVSYGNNLSIIDQELESYSNPAD